MKKQILISIVFLLFLGNSAFSQVEVYSDTLFRQNHGLGFSGDSLIVYQDYPPDSPLPLPKDKNGEFPGEYYVERINSPEKITQIANEIFTPEEISILAEHRIWVKFKVSSSGKVKSASFGFTGDPEIELGKLVEFSNRIKEHITLKIDFDREVVVEGYVGTNYRLFR